MTVRDLLEQEIDIDVLDDYTEELWVAFCGPAALTDAGLEKFGTALDFPVELRDVWGTATAIVHVEDDDELEAAKELFEGFAGFCSCEEWDEWFDDGEKPEPKKGFWEKFADEHGGVVERRMEAYSDVIVFADGYEWRNYIGD